MDLTLYRILTQHVSPTPDLSVVQQGQLVPEAWPVVLEKIVTFRKKIQHFVITDGKVHVLCFSDVPDLFERIATTEIGTIIHLLGCRSVFNPTHKCYTAYVEDFATLKQYDEHLKEVREAEALRQADLHDELTTYDHLGGYQPSGY